MSLLKDVGARLAEVVDGLPHGAVAEAAERLDRPVALLTGLAEGSEHPSLLASAAGFTRARDAAADLVDALRAVAEHVGDYLAALGGESRREVLVINNRKVCDEGEKVESLNCQNLLPKILGPGQELVVYSPTHTGGVRKWLFPRR